jgi:hypothetical protein
MHLDLLHGETNNEIKAQSRNKENVGKVLSLGLILATHKEEVSYK